MTKEQVELFQSDFKIVADYFVQKQESGDYIPSSTQIRHVQETLQLLSVMCTRQELGTELRDFGKAGSKY